MGWVGWHCYSRVGVLAPLKLFLAVLFKNRQGEIEGAVWKRGNEGAKHGGYALKVGLGNRVCGFKA